VTGKSNTSEKNDNKISSKLESAMPYKKYIHGFSSKKTYFPSFSNINCEEQASFLQLVKKFTPDRLPFLNRREQAELRVFMVKIRYSIYPLSDRCILVIPTFIITVIRLNVKNI
jgi:hypothetical protein